MKIAIISDTHFGYTRFEEDAFIQAERAFLEADEKADIIIYAGDVFDTKNPKLETINRAIGILKKIKKPVIAIHGNHERRSRDMINPVQLLSSSGMVRYVHGEEFFYEKNNEKVQIFGMGNVPEDIASAALSKAMEGFTPDKNSFRILVLHQSIKELMPNAGNEISLEELERMPFDLFINGHIHASVVKLSGRFLIPGSTVVTQLKKEETKPRGYIIYDTIKKNHEFVAIECRQFFYEEMVFKEASIVEVKTAVECKVKELKQKFRDSLIRIKIRGTLKEGVDAGDFYFPADDMVYLDNDMDIGNLKTRIAKIRNSYDEKLTIRELAMKELREKTQGRLTFIDPTEIFDKLVKSTDDGWEYVQKIKTYASEKRKTQELAEKPPGL